MPIPKLLIIVKSRWLMINDPNVREARRTQLARARNISASSGTVAVEHDWQANGAVLRGSASDLNAILAISGITFKPLARTHVCCFVLRGLFGCFQFKVLILSPA